ncbi:NACHT domain-containing protein [Candidatus Wolfebacteria bacterium]|nr:NACHT domain-containing protein [Candidatus Wolfebacteria bacterium]
MTKSKNNRVNELVEINFDQFRIKNPNFRESFEQLCYYLFCRRFKITKGILRHKNQIGIETEPVKVDKQYIGFECKFFENKIDTNELVKKIKKAKEKNPKITKIIFYLNQDFLSESQKKGQKKSTKMLEIEKVASEQKVEIEWVVKSHFEILLNQPSNLDLAELFFDVGDELGFIKNYANPDILTFLQSKEYINLPLLHQGKSLRFPSASILKSLKTTFLITGCPGSGKTILMHKLFQEFGGLNKNKNEQMIRVLQKNSAVPMLVNLKNCISDSLENILRNRQNDSRVRGRTLGFVYIFDGLDELSEEKADNMLAYMRELEQQDNTKRIIISCRSGNLNRIKLKVYLPNIIEYAIADLEIKHINQYFDAKENTLKKKLLLRLQKNNQELLSEIKDILMTRLLWDTIVNLDSQSGIIDLLEKKIELLLNDPNHKKNIAELNLLNPKGENLITLNQDIAFEFQKKFQFRYSQKELYNIILAKFPRLDYRSANELLNYLADLFFESEYTPTERNRSFVYQHRRYQEFFFVQKLKSKYENNPKSLRELNVLSNRDFLEKLFLRYMRKQYGLARNLIGMIEMNLIDVYLGKHSGYGVDDAYYLNSAAFIPSLASQENQLFIQLFEDNNLALSEKIKVDLKVVRDYFAKWKKDKDNFRTTNYLKSIWENGIASLLTNAAVFWRAGKKNLAIHLLNDMSSLQKLYSNNKFRKGLRKEDHLRDPFWERWEDYLYILIVIDNKTPKKILDNLVRKNYKIFSSDRPFSSQEEGKEKLLKSFFRVCLRDKANALFRLIDTFDEFEFSSFLDVLLSIEFLPAFIKNKSIHKKIASFLQDLHSDLNEKNYFMTFYKNYFGIKLSKKERKYLETELSKLRNERKVDWHFHQAPFKFAIISYVLAKNTFDELLKDASENSPFRYYDELALYSALFADFISLLSEKKNIETITRDYLAYVNIHDQRLGLYLKVDISFLWAYILTYSKTTNDRLRNIKNRLMITDNNIVPFSFCLKLNQLNPLLLCSLYNENEISEFESVLKDIDDYYEYINDCFYLSSFFSKLNKEKARFYFVKGINDGILRHGYRKDVIVSYLLVDALEILWRNNWESKEKLKEYTKAVFNLAMRVTKISDGAETWRGPYNVIDLIAKYDITLAEEYKKELIAAKGHSNFSNSVITSILIGKAENGFPIEDIESGMQKYRKDYDYENKPYTDTYEQKFKVYLGIAKSGLYTEQQKKEAFQKAFDQVEEMKKAGVTYYLRDMDFKEEKNDFKKLCKQYNKTCNVSFDEKKEEYHIKSKMSEKDFINNVRKAKTKPAIRGLYARLKNYKNGIELKKQESWKILIKKTAEITGNIKLFVDLIRDNSFPHTDFMTQNSKHFHFGVAAALEDIGIKNEILNYLFKNTGHGGFINIMKSYEVNEDKEMCRKLFRRYLLFCDLLVN